MANNQNEQNEIDGESKVALLTGITGQVSDFVWVLSKKCHSFEAMFELDRSGIAISLIILVFR